MLRDCVKDLPRLVGCEAAYLFPTNRDVCQQASQQNGSGREVDQGKEGAGALVLHVRSGDIFGKHPRSNYGQVETRTNRSVLLTVQFAVTAIRDPISLGNCYMMFMVTCCSRRPVSYNLLKMYSCNRGILWKSRTINSSTYCVHACMGALTVRRVVV